MLVFHLGDGRFAVDAREVVKIIPAVPVRALPHTPSFVAGVLDYEGQPVPAIDLCQLCLGRPCERLLSTRIMLAPYGGGHLVGLLAERMTEVERHGPEEFKPTGVDTPGVRFLGGVKSDARGTLQLVSVAELLTEEVRRILFQTEASAA